MSLDLRLLMLPGMGADARLFKDQIARFPNLQIPDWVEPLTNESLRSYASRFARVIDPGVPCIIGGASFGGIVALEMATHLKSVACVLIGSIRTPAELSWRWRVMRPLALLGPDKLASSAKLIASIPWLGEGMVRRLSRLARPESAFARWATCAVLRWQPSPLQGVQIFQLHGEFDHILPARNTRADTIVPGGSHALSLFNPSAVNDYLASVMQSVRVCSNCS
ncbi:MAG: alpha/beta hydrolase [Planctomycetaceae bacterium]|nr:alpha/beta hydrolase [Planctomycetaceae bacterium]